MVSTNLNTVVVSAQYVDFDGIPMSGSVVFTPTLVAIDVAGKKILMPKSYSGNLNTNGVLSLAVPASNDPDILPNIIPYTVTENIPGGRTFINIQIPYSAISSGFDLSTVLIDGAVSTGPTYLSTSDFTAVHLAGAEDISGVKNFLVSPVIPTPTVASHPTTKAYVDGVVIAGAPDATISTKGIIKLAGALGGTADSPSTPTSVHLSGNETVAGIKTFSSSPIVPTPTTGTQAVTKAYVDAADAVLSSADAVIDANAVHDTGNETIAGIKTFSSSPVVPTPTTSTQAANKTYVDSNIVSITGLRLYLNSADYGVVPNNSAIDSATLLNQLLADAKAQKKIAYIPTGEYYVGAELLQSSCQGWAIIGDAAPASAFNALGTRIRPFGAYTGNLIRITSCRNGYMDNIQFDGVGQTLTAIDYDAVSGGPGVSHGNEFRNINVYSCTYRAVRVGKSKFQTDQTNWYNCQFNYNSGTAVAVSIEDANSVWHDFNGCGFLANGIGISCQESGSTGGQFNLIASKFNVNTIVDIKPTASRATSIIGTHSEGSYRFITAGNASTATGTVEISGCSVNTITAPDGVGIDWGRTAPIAISGSAFRGSLDGTIGFKIRCGTSANRGYLTLRGVTFFDNINPFSGLSNEGSCVINAEGCVYGQSSTTGVNYSNYGPLHYNKPSAALVLSTNSGTTTTMGTAQRAWVTIPNATVLTTKTVFYLKSKCTNGNSYITVRSMTSRGGTAAELLLLDINAVDDNVTIANNIKFTVFMSAGATTNGPITFEVDVQSVPYTYTS